MTQRFSVKAEVAGVGPIHHMIRADNADAALERLCCVYPDRKITEFKAVRREVETTKEPSA